MLVEVDEDTILNELDDEDLIEEMKRRNLSQDATFKRDLMVVVDSYIGDSADNFRKNFVIFAKKYSHEAAVFL